MKDIGLSMEKDDQMDDELINKIQKHELEFDCHGISFSDTCSSVSRLLLNKVYT
jgi:hypothetical protein